ncbi:MAG: DUF134 domain-containing protein [Candidatus Magasanikbacteria bacterium]|jgi:uncharacterized protein|nr:DUF134 domain-containing protein [Candidatus Magasanikbacteria bacterium]MBT4071301.1 DUF134 domain-containing protein [Candidatus Magasanikbacteria bacterium]
MSPRPKLKKNITFSPEATYFKPRGIPIRNIDVVHINHEEMEAIRLHEVEELNQTECAKKMKTSQSTLQRILDSAHKKIATALIYGKAIEIIE